MPNPSGTKNEPPPREHSPMAAFLSYLVPGLGQIYQGRIGKGLLFLVCVYTLFFYGMALGEWRNVYLPDTAHLNPLPIRLGPLSGLSRPLTNLYNRPQFLGQFWVGIAAWPAVGQYNSKDGLALFGNFQRKPEEDELNRLQTDGDKTWDLAWVYTVIAGVLNILVIYDAFAGPAFTPEKVPQRPKQEAAPA